MALYIRDDSVNVLADLLVKATGKTKTEAVREALRDALARAQTEPSFMEAIAQLQEVVRSDGFRKVR